MIIVILLNRDAGFAAFFLFAVHIHKEQLFCLLFRTDRPVTYSSIFAGSSVIICTQVLQASHDCHLVCCHAYPRDITARDILQVVKRATVQPSIHQSIFQVWSSLTEYRRGAALSLRRHADKFDLLSIGCPETGHGDA